MTWFDRTRGFPQPDSVVQGMVRMLRDAQHTVEGDFDTQTVKVDGGKPMELPAFRAWVNGWAQGVIDARKGRA